MGDSHIKRVNKDLLKYLIINDNEKVHTKYFDGAEANEICHQILTTFHNDGPSRVIIHAVHDIQMYMRIHERLMWQKELLILV